MFGRIGILDLLVATPLVLGVVMICPGILGIPFVATFLRIG